MRGILGFLLCFSSHFKRRGVHRDRSQEPRQPWSVRAVGLLELVAAVAREIDVLGRVAGAAATYAAVLLVRVQCVTQGHRALELQAGRVGRALLVAAVAVGKVGEVVDALGPDEHAERE